jgi:mono/diheme cytochrome c family protein
MFAFGLGGTLGATAVVGVLYKKPGEQVLPSSLAKRIGSRSQEEARNPKSGPRLHPIFRNWEPVRSKRSPSWLVRRGLDVSLVTEGLVAPVALAAPDKPGDAADAPILYIGERSGRVRYLTRDGSLRIFAERVGDSDELSLVGLAIIPGSEDLVACVTRGASSGRVIRLMSKPGGRELSESKVLFELPAEAAAHYRIGPVVVSSDGLLSIAVDDGGRSAESLDRTSIAGKVLRLKLDGTAPEDNPFGPEGPGRLIFASGVGHIAGLAIPGGGKRLYAVERGPAMDRLFEVRRGESYCWNGEANSLRSNVLYTWGPGLCIAPEALTLLARPTFGEGTEGHGLIATDGTDRSGTEPTRAMLIEFSFDPKTALLARMPEPAIEYSATGAGVGSARITSLAEGPDALYIAESDVPAASPGSGDGRLWRVFASKETLDLPDANAAELARLTPEQRGRFYFAQTCSSCHRMAGVGGTEGPDLTHATTLLKTRLNSPNYVQMLEGMIKSSESYVISQRPKHKLVLEARGSDRVKVWLGNHLVEPRFDHPHAKMPSFESALTPAKRDDIIAFLLTRE